MLKLCSCGKALAAEIIFCQTKIIGERSAVIRSSSYKEQVARSMRSPEV